MEVTIIRKVELSMDEQKKYEVIKSLANHPNPQKQRAEDKERPILFMATEEGSQLILSLM